MCFLSRCDVINNAPQLQDGKQRAWTSFPDALGAHCACCGQCCFFVTPFIDSSWAFLSTSWDVIKKVGSYVAPLFHVLCLTSSLPIPAMLDMSTL